jgi:hypothetical protein
LPTLSTPTTPSGFGGVAQSTGTIFWMWSDNAFNEAGYRILIGTINVSGDLPANTTTWMQTGLGVNSTAGALDIQVFNAAGTANSTGTVTRYTLAQVPTALTATGVFESSATLTWSGSATTYQLERSTGGAYSVIASTTATNYINTALSGAATYYYRLLGLNADAVATAYSSTISVITMPTLSTPTAPSGFGGVAQSTSVIVWTWTDNSSNEAGFRVMAGTANVSGDLPANTTTWSQTSLTANTSPGALIVQAFNAAGSIDSSAVTRYTLASVPTGLAASSITTSSATLTWSGSATTYQLERSTGGGFSEIATTTATNYVNTSLSAAATYYYRLLGLNADATATAYSSTITVVTLPIVFVPGQPGTPVGTALGVSSISWNWTLASGATTHFLSLASNGAVIAEMAAGPYAQTGLSPNTAYGLRVMGSNTAGTGLLSSAATVYTLAAAPSSLTVSSVSASALALSWPLAGNPSTTLSVLQKSLDDVVYATALSAAATAFTDSGLLACTTYYYRVKNINGDGINTAYTTASGVTASLDPSAPSGLTATANAGGTVSLSWNNR